MEKMDGMSMDLTATNIEKLKELFPNAVTEGKIDFDMLRTMLGDEVDAAKEKYQFTWNGKSESIKLAQSPSSATLRPCKEKSKDWDTTENLYIEGDNLEVLKQLQKTYFGKIKMIYIDPPYNTGKDFVYKDDFKDSVENYKEQTSQTQKSNPETSGRYHTDWLNMMYPRLILARNLLSDDGVIFISIDDNEQANLKKICDEIFGPDNGIGPLIQNKMNAKNDTLNVQKNHEFVLAYRKGEVLEGGSVKPTLLREETKPKDVFEENGEYYYLNDAITTRGEGGTLNARPNLGYTVYYNPETRDKIAIADYDVELARTSNDENAIYSQNRELIQEGYIPIRPPKVRGKLGCWTWALDKFNNEKNQIVITGKEGAYSVKKRTFIPKDEVVTQEGKKQFFANKLSNSRSIIDYSTNDGTEMLNNTMGNSGFNNPKNLEMMEYLIGLVPGTNYTVLDFFSGSATTAHAVMRRNMADDRKRKFIMIQLPEMCNEDSDSFMNGYKTICEIGEERIRLAGEKIKADWIENHKQGNLLDEEKEFDTDIGCKVFTLDSTNINPWDNTNEYDEASLFDTATVFKLDRSNEDVLYEVMLKYGVFDQPANEVEVNGKTMYRVGQRHMIVCLEDKIDDSDITEICKLEPRVVVFKEDGFKDDNAKINAEYNLKKSGVEDVKCI